MDCYDILCNYVSVRSYYNSTFAKQMTGGYINEWVTTYIYIYDDINYS